MPQPSQPQHGPCDHHAKAYPASTLAFRGEQILNGTVEDTRETKGQG